jgi:hypothetical protein
VRIRAEDSLRHVAAAVAGALVGAGVDAVLTGGACAALFTDGAYQSFDLDFVLRRPARQAVVDAALASLGFRRLSDRYIHPHSPFFVEFPAGPLGIGRDLDIRPESLRIGRTRFLALSPTDSCRDRLAAYYHWDDGPSLEAAVEIAVRHPVDLQGIRAWSTDEGAADGFAHFLEAVRRRKARERRSTRKRRGS